MSQVAEQDLTSTVGRIAAVICNDRFPTGERAALRRMVPGQSPPLSFYRFALSYLPDTWDVSERSRADWMTLVTGIALMSPNAHRPDRNLGTALAEGGYSESRLERLLAADDHVRRLLLLRAARFLAAKGSSFNWADAARLLFTQDEDKRESLCRRIAGYFYRSLDN